MPSGPLDSKIKGDALENLQALQRIVQFGALISVAVAFTWGDGISVESDISVKKLKETELNARTLTSFPPVRARRMAKGNEPTKQRAVE